MKTYLDCFPCFVKQALIAARRATDDPALIRKTLDVVGAIFPQIALQASPPEIGRQVYKIVNEITGVNDPYSVIKRECIDIAASLYPSVKEKVRLSDDPLLTAVRAAIAGNVIDFGAASGFNLKEDLNIILQQEFAIFHYDELKARLKNASRILYLGDNAGETVFDRILIEELPGKRIKYVVREKPIINDTTRDDAIASGLDQVAEIISSGTDAPGTILRYCSDSFLAEFESADMIISKGQGNYEALSESSKPIFYLLKTKCKVIADDLGVTVGSIILKQGGTSL